MLILLEHVLEFLLEYELPLEFPAELALAILPELARAISPELAPSLALPDLECALYGGRVVQILSGLPTYRKGNYSLFYCF